MINTNINSSVLDFKFNLSIAVIKIVTDSQSPCINNPALAELRHTRSGTLLKTRKLGDVANQVSKTFIPPTSLSLKECLV